MILILRSFRLSLCAAFLLFFRLEIVNAATEPRTGVNFPDEFNGSSLSKWGVRTNGRINIYAVGQYDKMFLLQMTSEVNADNMARTLKGFIKQRCSSTETFNDFEKLILIGLKNGAPKGTKMVFGTGGGKLSLQVNGRGIGSIGSEALASAFEGIYTDKNAVCTMKAAATDEYDKKDKEPAAATKEYDKKDKEPAAVTEEHDKKDKEPTSANMFAIKKDKEPTSANKLAIKKNKVPTSAKKFAIATPTTRYANKKFAIASPTSYAFLVGGAIGWGVGKLSTRDDSRRNNASGVYPFL